MAKRKGSTTIPKARGVRGTFYGNLLGGWGFTRHASGNAWERALHTDHGRYQVLIEDRNLELLPAKNISALVAAMMVTSFESGKRSAEAGAQYFKDLADSRRTMIDAAKRVLNG